VWFATDVCDLCVRAGTSFFMASREIDLRTFRIEVTSYGTVGNLILCTVLVQLCANV